MTVEILDVCICDAHIEQKPVLIFFDTFQAYYVIPLNGGPC